MQCRLLSALLVMTVSGWAQQPAGRWDGAIQVGNLSVPFTMLFEGSGASTVGSFVNGSARVSATSGSFAAGKLHMVFEQLGTQLSATLADGALKGTYGNAKTGMHAFTANAYCTCSYEGEAGPDISGNWVSAEAGWRLAVQRVGEDTLATVTVPGGVNTGPLKGRFDGLTFNLHYFDGVQAVLADVDVRKDGGLDVVWKEPGQEVRKYKAVRAR